MENQNNQLFATIEQALITLKNKKPLIVVDDEDRENEGDLIYAAETITEQDIAFMLQHTSGIICVPCHADRLD
ncbi:MAG: 3,4-dihydroxy-2-butanone-4-phosphate synthase, partial [Nanoarchaeota archaeon]